MVGACPDHAAASAADEPMFRPDDLRDPDNNVRLYAAHAAGQEDGPEVIAALLEVALNDRAEVRTGFGLNDDVEHVGDAAAYSLRQILERRGGLDPAVRAAAAEPANDDERVGNLLRLLGPPGEPLRQEFEASPVGLLRLRALKAVLPRDRTVELTARFLVDPAPAVRAEAISEAPQAMGVEAVQEFLADPDPEVRRAASLWLGNSPAGSAPFLAAIRVETDTHTKVLLLSGLSYRMHEAGVLPFVVGCLAAEPWVRNFTAYRLYNVDDPGVAAAIGVRFLVEDGLLLHNLLRYAHLMKYVPQLRDLLARMLRHAPDDELRLRLSRALERPDGPPTATDPAAGLDREQRARLHQEVTRWAAAALGELELPGDLPEAMDAGVRAAVTAARRDPAPGREIPADRLAATQDVAAGWAAELTRLAHRLTAAQIRAGLDPLPPGPLRHLLLEDADPRVRVLVVGLADGSAIGLEAGIPAPGDRPESAALRVPCPACGVPHRVSGPLTWQYRDDDRYAESEDGYAGTLTGACPVCGAPGRAEVRVSVTRSRADGAAELSWDWPAA